MTPPRAFAVGYYGMSNFGDDLFRDVLHNDGERMLPGFRVRVFPSPRRSSSTRARAHVAASDSIAGSAWRLAAGILVVLRARMIVLGGGSVLSAMSGVRAVQSTLARLTGTRFRALGVSLGPFESRQDLNAVAVFLSRMDRVVVRDERSMRLASEMGLGARVSVGGDLAALYAARSPRPVAADPRSPRLVGLALCNTTSMTIARTDAIADALAASIRHTRTSSRDDRVLVLVLNNHPTHGDEGISAHAARRLRDHGLEVTVVRHDEADVGSMWSAIAGLDALVAVRLHAAVTAYLSSVPFLFVEYHPKCADFSTDIGHERRLTVPVDADQDALRAGLDRLLSNPDAPKMPAAEYVSRAVHAYLPPALG